MTLKNFHVPDDLWQQFLMNIQGEFDSYSQAIRELIKRYNKQKEASA